MLTRTSITALTAAVAFLAAGCGGDSSSSKDKPAAKRKIPHSLRVVESGAEDTTDFILAGERAKAIKSAGALNDAAQGDAAKDLADADVPAAQIDELKARAAELTKIVARGKPIKVALAANRAFELVPDFFGAYSDRVPAQVTRLDYLDFEAKLRALAGDRGRTADAVSGLRVAWKELRKKVRRVRPGGVAAKDHFDGHVRRMRDLVEADASLEQIAREAQHGLDLVDEIEAVYTG
jgi:hypothetical protein